MRMSSLPTAYANQRFGRKSLDFYAAAGDVIGADPRARADERRLQDLEGARHTVRLMESGFDLEPGEQASVLRMQPGPARRSRPVAVINHTRQSWSRTHPGATGLLARAGVARSVNWALTLTVFALAALLVVWPYLRAFLVEIDPALFSQAPQMDVFALAAAAAPSLADWRLSDFTGGLADQISAVAPGLGAHTADIVFAAAVLASALMVHALRSWRLVWAPVFVAGLGVGALGFNGAEGAVAPALGGLAIAAGVFIVFGLTNRVRDAARLERRIAVLADHILRNPPEEMVADLAAARETAPDRASGAVTEDDQADRAGEPDDAARARPAAALRSAGEDGPDGSQTPAPQERVEAGEAETGEEQIAEDAAAQVAGPAAETGASEEAEAQTPSQDDAASDASGSDAPAAEEPGAEVDPDEETVNRARKAEPEAEAEPDEAEAGDAADSAAGAPQADDKEGPATTFEQEESERLRPDPRYASRAIVLPPPPPMPSAEEDVRAAGQGDGESGSETPAPSRSGTRTLQPDAPLPSNVVPMFAPPAPSRRDDEPVD